MREIKFRVWDSISMKMWDWEVVDKNPIGDFTELNHYKVMQYTGLKSKSGVEIYEGDIIKVNDKNHYGKTKKLKYVISFIEGGFMCLLIDSKHATIFPKSMKNQPNIEVIGNIHQNPELCAK